MYTVQVNANPTVYSSYRDARDQADMVHGQVFVATIYSDRDAWRHATMYQGCVLDWESWQCQDDDERSTWEQGADGIGTA